MADEKIVPGEPVVSSGGDQIYPRGLPIGTVFSIGPDPEGGPFMVVRVKPSANLDRVEEVLVITQVIDKAPAEQETATGLRAADILAQRLPTVIPKPPEKAGQEPPDTRFLYAKKPGTAPSTGTPGTAKPSASSTTEKQQQSSTSSSTEEKPKPKPKPPLPAQTTDEPQGQDNPQLDASSTEEKAKPKPKPPTPAPTTDKPQVQENPQSEASSTEEKAKPKPKPPTPAATTDKPQVQENPQ
jgi:rod shape-determining protein MreC